MHIVQGLIYIIKFKSSIGYFHIKALRILNFVDEDFSGRIHSIDMTESKLKRRCLDIKRHTQRFARYFTWNLPILLPMEFEIRAKYHNIRVDEQVANTAGISSIERFSTYVGYFLIRRFFGRNFANL